MLNRIQVSTFDDHAQFASGQLICHSSVIVRVNSGSFETYRPLYLGVTFIDGLRIPWEFKADSESHSTRSTDGSMTLGAQRRGTYSVDGGTVMR
jgi:hypothetical protein